jgi:hypothetical protein
MYQGNISWKSMNMADDHTRLYGSLNYQNVSKPTQTKAGAAITEVAYGIVSV